MCVLWHQSTGKMNLQNMSLIRSFAATISHYYKNQLYKKLKRISQVTWQKKRCITITQNLQMFVNLYYMKLNNWNKKIGSRFAVTYVHVFLSLWKSGLASSFQKFFKNVHVAFLKVEKIAVVLTPFHDKNARPFFNSEPYKNCSLSHLFSVLYFEPW